MAITGFVALLLIIVTLGWRWTASHQPPPLRTASHVVLAIAALGGVFAAREDLAALTLVDSRLHRRTLRKCRRQPQQHTASSRPDVPRPSEYRSPRAGAAAVHGRRAGALGRAPAAGAADLRARLAGARGARRARAVLPLADQVGDACTTAMPLVMLVGLWMLRGGFTGKVDRFWWMVAFVDPVLPPHRARAAAGAGDPRAATCWAGRCRRAWCSCGCRASSCTSSTTPSCSSRW